MKSFVLAALALLAVGCNRPKEEYSTNKHQADMVALFNKHISAVQSEGEKLKLVGDGFIGVPSGSTNANEPLVLSLGDRLVTKPPHHTASIFEFAGVKDNAAVFKYDHKIDHRVSGGETMTIDRGEIEIEFK